MSRDLLRPAVLRWLLDSDPAIRWQVLQDLVDAPAQAVARERARVAREGWGAELLARQAPKGNWGGPHEDRGWLPTGRCLTVLKDLGLDPRSPQARRMIERVKKRIKFEPLGGRPFLEGETEPCINGRILGIGAYFDEPRDALARRLLGEQLPDGGWNCEAPKSKRSSFHTTICVLEGLLAYERARGKTAAVTKARRRGEKYLLERRMFRSLRTGEAIDQRWLRFAWPPFWHYDVLRGLDYLRDAGVPPTERVREAVEIVRERRHQNGRWPLNLVHPERIPLEMENEERPDPRRMARSGKAARSHSSAGSATMAPPRSIPPRARPAETSTRFLMMYCPSSVGAQKPWVKSSLWKRNKGMNVPVICKKSSPRVSRIATLRMSPSPMMDSQAASTAMATWGGTRPNVSTSIVRVASASAGLQPGRNFKTPNQKKTMPRPVRITSGATRAIHWTSQRSSRLAQ
jgi:hypothetical protein